MPQAYRIIQGDDDPAAYNYLVAGQPAALVPTVNCPVCGEHRPFSFHYPSIPIGALGTTVTKHLHLNRSGPMRSIGLDEYHELEAKLAPALGPDRPLSPLTGLGGLEGRAEGKFGDFAWPRFVKSVMARRSVFDTLVGAGVPLTGAAPPLKYRRERRDPLVELEAPPSARIHASQRLQPCDTCGLVRGKPRAAPLDAASFDDSIPVQRIFERPDILLVNEALATFIRERKLLDVNLIPYTFQ